MVNSYRIITLVVSLLIIQSCIYKGGNEILTWKVSSGEFTDVLILDGTVETVKSNTISCPRIYSITVGYIAEDGVYVKAGDTICILENSEMVDSYEKMKKRLELLRAEYNKNRADNDLQFALLDAEIKNNDAQTSISNLDSLQLIYSSEIQKKITALEIEKSSIEKKRFQRRREVFGRINQSNLKKFEVQIKQSETRLKDYEDKLKQLTLLSPQDGLFLRGNSLNGTGKLKKGDQMYPGFPIAEIPDSSAMRVKLSVSESDYKRIQLGDSVTITFDAMHGNKASGKITYKAPVGQSIKHDSKIKSYDLVASIEQKNENPGVGLSANCTIYAEHLKDTLTAPLISVFEEDSIKCVYVKSENKYEKREVMISESSAEKAVINAGLNAGEIVALMKPPLKKIKKTTLLATETKDKIKKLIALKQSQIKPMINGEPPRSSSGGNTIIIIMN